VTDHSAETSTVADAFRLLGEGAVAQSEEIARRLIAGGVPGADPHFLLGMALMQQGRAEEAVGPFFEAANRQTSDLSYAYTYGGCLLQLGHWTAAAEIFAGLAERDPDYRDARYFAGLANLRGGRWPDAIEILKPLAAGSPNDSRVRVALSQAWAERFAHPDMLANAAGCAEENRPQDALYWYARILREEPTNSRVLWSMAETYTGIGRVEDAISTYRRYIATVSDDRAVVAGYANIAWIYSQKLMDAERAVAAYRELLRLPCDPETERVARHELLFYLPQATGATPEELRDEAVAFQQRFGSGVIAARRNHANDPDPERRLRVGFVSRLFGRWSYSRQILPMLRHNDSSAFEIYCYHIAAREPIEPIVRAEQAVWFERQDRSMEEIAEIIARDEIDILIDCNGASAACGYEIFARKPAPVQIAWSNKSMTTGSTAMDYFIADEVMLEGQDAYFTEKLYRMPCYYVPYPPLEDAPPVENLPYDRNGYITFGTLATPCKFGEECWRGWGRVLKAIPDARLFIKNANTRDGAFQSYVANCFAAVGIDRDQLIFSPGAPHHEFLKGYGEIDVALDTMPMTGGNTIVEALWQGVPTISKLATSFVSRSTRSIYSRIGLTDYIAKTEDDFVSLAGKLAGDPAPFRRLRHELRPMLAQSTIFDSANFAAEFQVALRSMWRQWCRTRATESDIVSGPFAQVR
jgi:protein O-GlcNAc transferase